MFFTCANFTLKEQKDNKLFFLRIVINKHIELRICLSQVNKCRSVLNYFSLVLETYEFIGLIKTLVNPNCKIINTLKIL